jgi:hypothetical protein
MVLPTVFFPVAAFTQVSVRGFVDSYHAARVKSPHDYLSSRNRLRLEMFADEGDALAFASVNALEHHILPSQSGIMLREAWLEYMTDSWDVRVGRQIIVWGKADGVQITDVISPMDYTEFLARDYDDIRTPVDSFKFRLLKDLYNLEFIWVPVFKAAVLPGPGNPWAVQPDFADDVEIVEEEGIIPKAILQNSEYGGKIAIYLSGVDLALSALHTWDKFPLLRRQYTLDNRLLIRTEHHRLTFLGLEFSMPMSTIVLRGESAFFTGKRLETVEDGLLEKQTLKWLVGVDWFPGDGWNTSAQVTGTKIFSYEDIISEESHTYLATLHCSKKMLRETLTLATFAYAGLNHGDVFDRSSVEYALTDELHLSLGVDLFTGSDGMFGQYQDNDEIWVKARYSF